MRFVAGRCAEAELLAEAPWRSAIRKLLLAGVPLSRTLLAKKTQGCIGKMLLAEAA